MSICYPLSEGYHMRRWNIMWYNCEGNFGGVAIVIVADVGRMVRRMCGVC